jgi:hypothetical protein
VVIALTTAPVLYRHFIDLERVGPARLTPQLLRATVLYMGAGVLLYSPVFFFGGTIFSFAFGTNWEAAGHIASILSLAYVGVFALNGVQSIFYVTARLKLQCTLEIITAGALLITAIVSVKLMDFETALVYLCGIWCVRNIVLLAACVVVAHRHPSSRAKVT